MNNAKFHAAFMVLGKFKNKREGSRIFTEQGFSQDYIEQAEKLVIVGRKIIQAETESEFIAKIKEHIDNPYALPLFNIDIQHLDNPNNVLRFSDEDFGEAGLNHIPTPYHFLKEVVQRRYQ